MGEIYFATNREVKYETSKNAENFGDRFNAMGPQCFRVGVVDVELTGNPLDTDDDAWQVGRCTLYPEVLDSRRKEGEKLGSAAMFEKLRTKLKGSDADVIIYIHGFANDFANAARRAAALEHLYRVEGRETIIVMFSWPSDGKIFPSYYYSSDRDDAEASALAMARTLKRLVEFLEQLRLEDRKAIRDAQRKGLVPEESALKQCRRKLHLVAHSMGNWALRHAIVKFSSMNEGRVPRILDNAFIMAADVDADAFETKEKFGYLPELANRVHVYHAKDDVVLEIADRTKGNPNRLGSDGPENLDRLHERIVAIDCSKVSDTILWHGRHQYYRLREEVIGDVISTLAGHSDENRPGRVTIRSGRSWMLKDRG